jgi:hypothetical protein
MSEESRSSYILQKNGSSTLTRKQGGYNKPAGITAFVGRIVLDVD